jgi:hypothetical protein
MLQQGATSALKGLRRARQQPLSARESVERDDRVMLMEAMANPKKLVAVYFAMAEAMGAADRRALSNRDLAAAEELFRATGQEALTAEALEAVEPLARKRNGENVGRTSYRGLRRRARIRADRERSRRSRQTDALSAVAAPRQFNA